MKYFSSTTRIAILGAALICVTISLVFTVGAFAQEKSNQTTKLLVDNDKYRVNETRAKPGERNNMTKRPDRIIVHFNAGKQKVTCADGKTEEREFKAGTAEFQKADECQSVNIGTTETHNLVISTK
jgi:hypothetical protein